MKKVLAAIGALLALTACACTRADASDGAVFAHDSATETTDEAELTFALMGDVVPATTFPDNYLPADNGFSLFDDCRETIGRADIAAANLEGVLLDGPGSPRPMTNPSTYFLFRVPTEYALTLDSIGFDFLGIANNHINDFGREGRASTMQTLRRIGMAHAGLRDSCDFAVIERKGLKVAVTQFGHGDNNLDINDLDALRATVAQMRAEADIVVVAFHGGAEGADRQHVPFAPEVYVGERRGNVSEFAHTAIDAGADLVYGHGPHVARGWELYKERLVIYSLGNFCTPFRMRLTGPSGVAPLAEVTIGADGKFRSGKIHSFVQQPGRGPRADSSLRAAALIATLSAADFPQSPLAIGADGSVTIKKQPKNQLDS